MCIYIYIIHIYIYAYIYIYNGPMEPSKWFIQGGSVVGVGVVILVLNDELQSCRGLQGLPTKSFTLWSTGSIC